MRSLFRSARVTTSSIYRKPNRSNSTRFIRRRITRTRPFSATKLDAQNTPEKYDGVTTEKFSDEHPDSKRIFDEQIEKIEVKVFEKIHSIKLGRYEKKLAKEAQKIVKYEHKIDDLKEKMSKLHHAQTV